jgi:hypothetical protein
MALDRTGFVEEAGNTVASIIRLELNDRDLKGPPKPFQEVVACQISEWFFS